MGPAELRKQLIYLHHIACKERDQLDLRLTLLDYSRLEPQNMTPSPQEISRQAELIRNTVEI